MGTVYLLAETGDVARRAERFGLISAGMLLICFAIALLSTSTVRHLVTDPLTGLAETAQIVTREEGLLRSRQDPLFKRRAGLPRPVIQRDARTDPGTRSRP